MRSSIITRTTIAVTFVIGLVSPLAANAQYPGTNGRLFFVGGTNGNVISANPDGTQQTTLTDQPNTNTVAVNKAGTKYADVETGISAGIYVANVDGSGSTRISTDANDVEPTFSPDGTKLFVANAGNIVSMSSADGSGRTTVATAASGFAFSRPVISPDGNTLFFLQTNNSTNATDIMSTPATGGTVTNLTNNPSGTFDSYFDVSPDGTKLVIASFTAANYLLTTMPVAGGSQTTIASNTNGGSGSVEFVTVNWSPDGTKLVATEHAVGAGGPIPTGSYTAGKIFTMNADGSGATQVLTSITTAGPVYWSVVALVSAPASTGLPNTGMPHSPQSNALVYLAIGLVLTTTVIEVGRRVRVKR